MAAYDAPCVFFYVVRLVIPNYGGLGGGTVRCAGSSMAGKTNSVQSTTYKIGLFGGGFKHHILEAALWLQPSIKLIRYFPSLLMPIQILPCWPIIVKSA
ncbi:hypothetical protein [Lonsdalea iberica]|uniref:hypothetical protein n=1 Tax=Lonsdalea iberica TaxID=1082703 RepID=UPI003F5DDD00